MKSFKRVLSCAISAIMISASMPAATVVIAADQQILGNIGGYDYEMWNQDGQGQASMEPSAGSFTCSWSNIENFLARMGKKFDSNKKNYRDIGNITLSYDVEYTPRGNSYMCVYGWTRNPLMEYYIVEGWGDWRPPGNGGDKKGTVSLNGNTYDIFKTMRYNQPSIEGTATFPQYWSVRQTSGSSNNQTNYMKGTVSVSKHFDAWAKAGLDMTGTLYEVSLNIEGYRSNGSANVKSVSLIPVPDPMPEDDNDNEGQQDGSDNGGDNSGEENVITYEGAGSTEGVAVHQNLNYKYEKGGDGFKDYMGPYFRLGVAVPGNEINKSVAQEFIKKNYNSITCMNEMKPDSIVKSVNGDEVEISFYGANNILKFAEENGIGVRGHTFVWYSQTPNYLFQDNREYVSKDRMNKRLESLIKNTFTQLKSDYPDLQVHSYDVCSELFVNDGGGMRPAINSNWTRVYGEDNPEFVVNAFKYAREYAPEDCKLYLSDYNEYISAKTDDLINMAKTVMKEGDYIDGIGMEAYIDSRYPSASEFETAIEKFESLGLDIQLTELNISNSTGTYDQLYPQIFEVAMKHAKNISCVTFSGTTDEVIWRYDNSLSLPFSNYQPKPFYKDIIALADKIAPPTVTTTDTTTTATTTTTTTTTTKTTTTTTTTSSAATTAPADLKELLDSKVEKWGDANGDGNIDMGDAVIIMQSLANPNKYKLSDQGMYNADVYEAGGGITTNDAAAIQKYLLGLIKSLPESYSSSINTVQTATTTKDTTTTTKTEITTTTSYINLRAHQNLDYRYEKGGNGFKDYMGPYFRLGTVVSSMEIANSQAQHFIKKNYNSITCEYEMLPDSIVKSVNGDEVEISLYGASNMLKFAEENGIGVRGRTFVWYSQTPAYLFQDNRQYISKDRMNKRLESMIKNTFAQIKSDYPDLQLHSYDVCTELFVNDGGGMRPATNCNWTRVYGEDNPEFVVNAFKYARQYAPEDCKLYLNDFNEYMSAKTDDLINMAKTIMKEGDYIDGIGMEAHLDSRYPSASEFETAIEKFESLGLDIQITELDITNSTGTNGKLYPQIFEVAMRHAKNISCVTLWGTTDERSWRCRENGGSPLPFSNYQPKSFYNDIITLAKKVGPGSITSTTTTIATTTTTKTSTTTVAVNNGDQQDVLT
ncbi:endo-1,4-beta-xylanase [Ruminococcus sp.]|uniref:endo-1,4-beta-xylanase n=1 Tax=Ruminococcus sp. TaxID=41978 RepID=UPI0025CFFE1B|nr:endo-1,4-beta-xylanase [Ruminococcus sp.]